MHWPEGHFIPHFFGSLEVGSPPPPKLLASCPTLSHLQVGVICLVKRGIQHAQLSFLHPLFSWEQPSPRERPSTSAESPCSEERLADSVLQHKEACMRADGNHTLHHLMCNKHIFPTSLPYFTFCSEHRWAVGEAIVASLQS